jgi:hypothetical protein
MAVGPELRLFGADKEKLYPFHTSDTWRVAKHPYETTPFMVGVAGKVYPGYRIDYERKLVIYPWSSEKVTQYVYDLESLKEVIGTMSEVYLKTFVERKQDPKGKYLQWCEDNCKKFFEADHTKEHVHFFFEHKVPVFVLMIHDRERDHLYLNSSLRDVQFFKKLDPFTAFQEISMYISGVLGVGEPNIVTISDVQKARKHGFDKGSFRTHTPGKKAKRWK